MYKIVGADQKEYGPISADQIRQWIAENRANGQTLASFESGPWKPLSTFAEFALILPNLPPPPLSSGASLPEAFAGSVRTNRFAVSGLVCSCLGLFCCGPFFATLGLILSSVGLVQISRRPDLFSGKGLAFTGIVLAVIGYIIFAVLLMTGVLDFVTRGLPGF